MRTANKTVCILLLAICLIPVRVSYADQINPINLAIGILTLTQAIQGQHRCQPYPIYQQQYYEPYPRPYNLQTIPIQPGYVPNRTYYEANSSYTQPPMNDYEFSMKLQMCRDGNLAFCESLMRRLMGY